MFRHRTNKKGGERMAKRVKFDLELPDELFAQFHEKEIEAKGREALVMELLTKRASVITGKGGRSAGR
jgi:hypothetical protein